MRFQAKQRGKLILFLQDVVGPYSGKFFRKVLESNLCRINGKVERFGSSVIEKGDVVELCKDFELYLEKKEIKLDILFENDSFLIVNKPPKVISEDHEIQKILGKGHFLVHRLDKDTTGLLIIAKCLKVKEAFIALFEKKEVKKSYLALVDGDMGDKSGLIDTFFGKKGTFQGQTIWGSISKGVRATTEYKAVACSKFASLVECMPITGRTHQIRVHMAELNHPILVDRQYASHFKSNYFASRPLLHARRLEFVFNDQKIEIEAKLPQDFLDALRYHSLENPDR